MSESLTAGFLRLPYPGQRWVDLETLAYGAFDDTVQTLYTAPSTVNPQAGNTVTSRVIFVDAWFCNTDDVAHTLTIHIVPSGGSASAANAVFYGATIKANQSLHYSGMRTLIPAGGTIQALADVQDVVAYRFTGEVVR